MTISVKSSGKFDRTRKTLTRLKNAEMFNNLDRYGAIGTAALASATPVETGATAAAWRHEVKKSRGSWSIAWFNDNVNQGAQIALLLQFGHGTGTGGYVRGTDYINPAIVPIFEMISSEVSRMIALA